MTDRLGELGSSELEVLRTLWERGPCTVRDVLAHLHDRGRRVAYTTVLTFLSRLEQKGFASSNKSGLAYVYRAKGSRDPVSRSKIKSLLFEPLDRAAGPPLFQTLQNYQ